MTFARTSLYDSNPQINQGYADYANGVNNPYVHRDLEPTAYLKASNFQVNYTADQINRLYMSFFLPEFHENPTATKVLMHLEEHPASHSYHYSGTSGPRYRIYGTKYYPPYLGFSNAGYYLNEMYLNRTSSYVDITNGRADFSDFIFGTGSDTGTGNYWFITPLLQEMYNDPARAQQGTFASQYHFLIVRDDIQQSELTAENFICYSAYHRSDERKSPAILTDIPTRVQLSVDSVELRTECHEGGIPKGLGDTSGNNGEYIWFKPSIWYNADKEGREFSEGGRYYDTTNLGEPVSTKSHNGYSSLPGQPEVIQWNYFNSGSLLNVEPDEDGAFSFGDRIEDHIARGAGFFVDPSPFGSPYPQNDDIDFTWSAFIDSEENAYRVIFGNDISVTSTLGRGLKITHYRKVTSGVVEEFRVGLMSQNKLKHDQFGTPYNGGLTRTEWLLTSQGLTLVNATGFNHVAIRQDRSVSNKIELFVNGHLCSVENGRMEYHSSTYSSDNPVKTAGEAHWIRDDIGPNFYGIGLYDTTIWNNVITSRFRGRIDDLRIYRRTLTENEISHLASYPGILGAPVIIDSVDGSASSTNAQRVNVDRHNILPASSESRAEASSFFTATENVIELDSAQSQSENLRAGIHIPTPMYDLQAQSEVSDADITYSAEASPNNAQSVAECRQVKLDLSGAANADEIDVVAEAQSVTITADRVLEGLGGETTWVSASRDNDNEDTTSTENFVSGEANLTVGSGQWKNDLNDGGDHSFGDGSQINIPGGLF